MKNKLLALLSLFLLNETKIFSQWQTNGPYGGPAYALQSSAGNVFCGTGNGVFKSPDHGQSWNAANSGLERKVINAIAANSSGIFISVYSSGVYMSADNGVSWTARNNGLTDFIITSLYASDSCIYAGTPTGVFFSNDNGNSWTLKNNGIPSTYSIYSFTQSGTNIYAATYGMGLYMSSDNGGTWTVVAGGFPANVFVYALIANGSDLYAGTSAGIHKSSDGGSTWTLSNTGFPSGMWAKSFAIQPGYIFAGTYSEGIFVSTDNGATWNAMNNGIPDLPFPTGLPHNYPSVEALLCSGPDVIAATVDGVYLSNDNGNTWYESFLQILGTNVTAIAAGYTPIFAGTERNGVYTSWDQGASWMRTNNGLTSYDVKAIAVKDSSVFVSVMNQKVFRSDDYGGSWVPASSGLTSDVGVLEADNISVMAITTGGMFVPRSLFRTYDKGLNWIEITTSFTGAMTAVASQSGEIYVGTDLGKIYYSNNNGSSWQDISGTLPAVKINSILLNNTMVYAGTDGSGVYTTGAGGTGWNLSNAGIANDTIRDLIQEGGTIYAITWGGGVYSSTTQGASWNSFNTGLGNLHGTAMSGSLGNIYAATDAGAYSLLSANAIAAHEMKDEIIVYPNPGSGIIRIKMPPAPSVKLSLSNGTGQVLYEHAADHFSEGMIDVSGLSKGFYVLSIRKGNAVFRKKIIIE
jgi:photosystem II stability/assembly factor-like uncharacterized protein